MWGHSALWANTTEYRSISIPSSLPNTIEFVCNGKIISTTSAEHNYSAVSYPFTGKLGVESWHFSFPLLENIHKSYNTSVFLIFIGGHYDHLFTQVIPMNVKKMFTFNTD